MVQAEIDIEACPTCGESLPAGASECPKCGEALAVVTQDDVEMEKEPRGRNYLFYMGIILVVLGGPGIALGSWLHDLLRIPIGNYDTFDSFGWANRMTSAGGIVILLVGMLLLAIAISRSRPERGEDEI